jgi:hypothetical protein
MQYPRYHMDDKYCVEPSMIGWSTADEACHKVGGLWIVMHLYEFGFGMVMRFAVFLT